MTRNLYIMLTAVLATVGFSFSLRAQELTIRERILQDPEYAYLEYRDYPVPDVKPAPAPKGYKPVYISHYGRHGARYNYLQEGYTKLGEFFVKAVKDSVLTEAGRELAGRYLDAWPFFENRAGDLTEKGVRQHHGIGERMYDNYRDVFRRYPVVDAISTTVPRAIMSMVSFCDAIEEKDSHVEIHKSTSEAYSPLLHPHRSTLPFAKVALDSNKPYGKEWKKESRELRARVLPGDAFLSKYFTDLGWVQENFGKQNLVLELYYLMISTECTSVPFHFTDLYTPEQLYGFWEVRNLLYYTKWGMGYKGLNPSFYITAYLLQDIMDKADEALASGRTGANLRFGHDTVIGMLLTLMDVDGWNTGVEHPGQVKDVYDFSNIPMAANVQLVFYRNKAGDVLVRMMLNEKDLRLPLEGDTAPYYSWDAFSKHYRPVVQDAMNRMAE